MDFIAHSRGLFELEIACQFGHFGFELLDAFYRLLRRHQRHIATRTVVLIFLHGARAFHHVGYRLDDAARRYAMLDVVLNLLGAAPIGLGSTGNTAMNVAASLLGCPALTLPLLHDEGMPLGLQLLGALDRDAALFEVANWVARDVFDRADLVGAA